MNLTYLFQSGKLQYLRIENSRSRSALVFSIIFLVSILVLSLIEDTEILLVLALYLCIFLEGVSICAFLIYSHGIGDEGPDENGILASQRQPPPRGSDVVSSMNLYVMYAGRGSSHSRREIAFMIKNVVGAKQSGRMDEFDYGPFFRSDLDLVVNRYTDGNDAQWKNRHRESKKEREAYLTSLERIVQKLDGF